MVENQKEWRLKMETPWYCIIPGNRCYECSYANNGRDCQDKTIVSTPPEEVSREVGQ